jgi:hypothetical protein
MASSERSTVASSRSIRASRRASQLGSRAASPRARLVLASSGLPAWAVPEPASSALALIARRIEHDERRA